MKSKTLAALVVMTVSILAALVGILTLPPTGRHCTTDMDCETHCDQRGGCVGGVIPWEDNNMPGHDARGER